MNTHFLNRLKAVALPLSLLAALTLSPGCGGGGGGGGAVPQTSTSDGDNSLPTGSARFSVDFPPSSGGRQASLLPASTELVLVSVFAVEDGVTLSEAEETAEIRRPSTEGGPASTQIVLHIGRYLAKIEAKNANGQVVSSGLETVLIEPKKISSVPATLGIVHDSVGFSPSTIAMTLGQRLVVRSQGNTPGMFGLEGNSHCEARLEHTGALACTLRQTGTFTLYSPEGHTATVTVASSETGAAAAKPSLGVQRAEGLSFDGAPFMAHFTVNNGGESLPEGAKFDDGKGGNPVPATSNPEVSYEKGGYTARLLDSSGGVLAQVYVAVFEADLDVPTGAVTLASLPETVSSSTLTVTGSAPGGATVVIEGPGGSTSVVANSAGQFTAQVALDAGQNLIKAYVLSSEGVEGPSASATVSYVPDTSGGILARLEISGLPEQISAGDTLTFTVLGFDAHGDPVSVPTFTATLDGVTATQTGPGAFMVIGAGTGVLHISGPNELSASSEVTVVPGAVALLSINPGNTTTTVGQMAQFLVSAKDAYGNVISDPSISWSATGDMSAPGQDGTLTFTTAGFGVVKATSNGVTAQACISVNGNSNMTRMASR